MTTKDTKKGTQWDGRYGGHKYQWYREHKVHHQVLARKQMEVTKDFLKPSNVPDVASIPISSEYYINESNNLTQEQIDNIMFP